MKKLALFLPTYSFTHNLIPACHKNFEVRLYYYSNERKDKNIEQLKKEIDEYLTWADVAHFEWAQELLIVATKMIPKKCKIVCRLHSNEAFNGKSNMINWDKVDDLIFVNNNVQSIACSNYIIANNKPINSVMHVVSHDLDFNIFKPKLNRTMGYKIGISGHIEYKKNSPLYLYAFHALYNYNKKFKLYIAGEHTDLRLQVYFDHYIKENKLPVIIEGRNNDMSKWYEDKIFLLNTSIFEGCFYSASEAMYMGVIPLIHNWPGSTMYPKEFIWNTVDECVNIVKRITNKNYTQIIEKNHIYAKEKFTATNMDKIIAIINR